MPATKLRLRSWRHHRTRRVEVMEVATATLRVAVQGQGPPLLLIPGIGGNLDLWAPLERHLRGFEVITFDPPGTGDSGPIRFPLSMAGMARLAARLMEALGRDRIDVLGYSWGGALAQELAHRHPALVRRLVLCATSCGLGGMPGSPQALAAFANPWPYYSRTQRDPRFGRPPTMAGYATQLCAIARWTSLPWLHELRQPTLVVAGDSDSAVPLANARWLAARIPDSRLHVVPGAGHLLLVEQAEEVAAVARDFLLAPGGEQLRVGRRHSMTLGRGA